LAAAAEWYGSGKLDHPSIARNGGRERTAAAHHDDALYLPSTQQRVRERFESQKFLSFPIGNFIPTLAVRFCGMSKAVNARS